MVVMDLCQLVAVKKFPQWPTAWAHTSRVELGAFDIDRKMLPSETSRRVIRGSLSTSCSVGLLSRAYRYMESTSRTIRIVEMEIRGYLEGSIYSLFFRVVTVLFRIGRQVWL